jgi:hypothetical protein
MTQGYEANHSGRFLEDAIEHEFKARRVHIVSWIESEGGNLDLFTAKQLLKGAPYKSIYGCASRSEFLYSHYPVVTCRIECKWQEGPGSVDEKFPYLIMNAQRAMVETNIWIVLDGGGARADAIQWIKVEALKIENKKIRIFSLIEAKRAIKDLVEKGIA